MITHAIIQPTNNRERASACPAESPIRNSLSYFLEAHQKFKEEYLGILFIFKIMTYRKKYSS